MLLRFPDRSPVRPLNPPSGFWNQKKISSEYSAPAQSAPKKYPKPRREPAPPPEHPRESARGSHPLAPHPRGGVGEQSAPRSRRRERKISRKQFPHRRKRMPSKEQPCIVGNERRQKDNPCIVGNERRQKDTPCIVGNEIFKRAVPVSSETNAVKRTAPASSETKLPARAAPGERERVATLSHPVPRGDVGERSAPRSRRRKQRPQKNSLLRRKPILQKNSPRRAREGVNPLDFQSRPATCAAERLLAQRASKSLRDRPSEIEDFGWSPPGADFFGVGACPPEKKSLPCRFRARKSAGFQRNLRKGGAEGNLSPPPPGELERVAALSTFNQKDFPQENRILFL